MFKLAAWAFALVAFSMVSRAEAFQAPKTSTGKPEPAPRSIASIYIENTSKVVSLTEEQKKAITAIFEAREKASKEFESKNAEKIKEVSEAIVAAYRSMDKEAIAKATQAREELFSQSTAHWKKSQEDLNNVLTPAQQTKLKEHQLTMSVKAMTAPITLTEEQWAKIRKATGGGPVIDWLATNRQLEATLTPAQKEAIAKFRLLDAAKMSYQSVKFTTEQQKSIEAACDELVKGNTKIGLAPEMWTKLSEKINRLMTAEQKDTYNKARQRTDLWQPLDQTPKKK